MKKYLYPMICLLILTACQNEKPKTYTIVSGTIANADGLELTLNNMDRTISESIAIGEDGSFSDTLQIETWGNYYLTDSKNRTSLFLEPGNHISIDYDASDFENTIEFSGKGFEASNYLFDRRKKEMELFRSSGTERSFYELQEKEFKHYLIRFQDSLNSLLARTEGLPTDFRKLEKRHIEYFRLNLLSDYEMAHAHYTKNKDFKASAGFFEELEGLDCGNSRDFLFSPNYGRLIGSNYRKKVDELVKKDSLVNRDVAYLDLIKATPDTIIRNGLLFERARFGITYAEDLESYYNDFMAASTNTIHKEKITESYEKLQKVAAGQPSPMFTDYVNYKGGTTSLDDLKGKYVYIDVWATWCGPCIGEIPSLKRVEKQYHGKNIEFLSISIDRQKDMQKWKDMIVEKDLKGVQVFADNDWNSQFVQDYLIQGIPRFILIDPEGNIVKSNAPRPSSPELVKLFEELEI